MGGSMALQMGYRFRPEVGGIFSLSSFLNRGSKVYEVCSFTCLYPFSAFHNFDII